MLIPQSLACAMLAGLPPLDFGLWTALAPAAFLISVIGFVESVLMAQTLAKRHGSRAPRNSA